MQLRFPELQTELGRSDYTCMHDQVRKHMTWSLPNKQHLSWGPGEDGKVVHTLVGYQLQ